MLTLLIEYIRSFYNVKGTIKKVNRQATEWEKACVICTLKINHIKCVKE